MYYLIDNKVNHIQNFISKHDVQQVSIQYYNTVLYRYSDEQDHYCYLRLKEIDIALKMPTINKWRLICEYDTDISGFTYYPGGEQIIKGSGNDGFIRLMSHLNPNQPSILYVLYNESTKEIKHTTNVDEILQCDGSELLRVSNNIKYVANHVIKIPAIIQLTSYTAYLLFDFKDVLFTALSIVKQYFNQNLSNKKIVEKVMKTIQGVLPEFADKDVLEKCYMDIKTSQAWEYKDIKQIYNQFIIGNDYFEKVVVFCKQYLSMLNFTAFFGKINHEYVLEVYPYFTTTYTQNSEIKYVTQFYRKNVLFVCFTNTLLFDSLEIELLKDTFVKIKATVSQHKHYFAGVETILTNVTRL